MTRRLIHQQELNKKHKLDTAGSMIVQPLARGFAYRQRAVCEGLESPSMFFDVFRTYLSTA